MNKKIIIPIVFLVLVILVGGYFFINSRNTQNQQSQEEGFIEENIPSIDPEDIGLTLQVRSDKKAVKILISKAGDITEFEYELSYEADLSESVSSEDGDGSGRISRGISDDVVLDGKSSYESKFLDLGSCSSGTCKYDTGVEEVKVVMKITKKDGKLYQVEDTVKL